MILPFSTQLNGKPTYFVEKIWKGLKTRISKECYDDIVSKINPLELTKQYIVDTAIYDRVNPKVTTIRKDKNNRWKAGIKIHFAINIRQKNMILFAPVIPVQSTQKIEIVYTNAYGFRMLNPYIKIDDKIIDSEYWDEIATNDGFDTVSDFFQYFNTDFTGKIIHWTDLKY